MPSDLATASRDRVLGMIKAYLQGKATERSVYVAVNSSPFRDEELEGILAEAEKHTPVHDKRKHMLMMTLRAGLKDRLLLT